MANLVLPLDMSFFHSPHVKDENGTGDYKNLLVDPYAAVYYERFSNYLPGVTKSFSIFGSNDKLSQDPFTNPMCFGMNNLE